MKRFSLPMSFVLLCLAPAVYAEGVCEPVARGMEIMAETPNFIISAKDSTKPNVDMRMEITPDSVTIRRGKEEPETESRADMTESMREEAERVRKSGDCVLLREEELDGLAMQVFAPDGEDRPLRIWLSKNGSRIYKVVADEEVEMRLIYPQN